MEKSRTPLPESREILDGSGLERWILLKELGSGTFGTVFCAKDSKGELPEVAIKVIEKSEMDSNQVSMSSMRLISLGLADTYSAQTSIVLKEVTIMRLLHHDNIAKFIGFCESERYYYIVLELCSGGDIFSQITRLTYFSEDLSRHVIIQVAKALKYLHDEKGIIHG